jgi:hypothetical protein
VLVVPIRASKPVDLCRMSKSTLPKRPNVSSSIGIARLGIMLGVGVMVRVIAIGVMKGEEQVVLWW